MPQSEPNYWIVAAMLGGTKDGDIFKDCIERGYWYCWEPNKESAHEESSRIEEMRDLVRSMKSGDRIAIKKQLGSGDNAKYISIRAIGIVKTVDLDEWRVYVAWLLPHKYDNKEEVDRRVPKKGPGAISAISGPFQNIDANKEWLPAIFCI